MYVLSHMALRSFQTEAPPAWEVYLLLTLIVGLACIRRFQPEHFANLLTGMTSYKLANQMFRRQDRLEWPTYWLMANAVVVLSLTGAKTWVHFGLAHDVPGVFLVMLSGICGYLALRSLLHPVIAKLIRAHEAQKIFDAHTMLAVQVWGVLALPAVVIGAVIGETWVYVVGWIAAVLVVVAAINFGRGVLLARPHLNARPAHFFIYLCGLNVSPMLLAAKALQLGLLEI